jgi:hypothetical protein
MFFRPMKRVGNKRRIGRLLAAALVIGLLANNFLATTTAYFIDSETATGNSFQAWSASLWTQTTQADFQEGVLNQVDITSSPDNVKLATESSDWYDANWARRAPVTINNSGSGLSDYQVKVDVTYDADMQPDFDDIRFVDSNGSDLYHWRQSYTASTSATFWVKVPSVPAGTKIIYIYYGNATASSASNGEATFDFFDDFNDATIDTNKWEVYSGTWSETDGALKTSTTGLILSATDEQSLPKIFDAKIYWDTSCR